MRLAPFPSGPAHGIDRNQPLSAHSTPALRRLARLLLSCTLALPPSAMAEEFADLSLEQLMAVPVVGAGEEILGIVTERDVLDHLLGDEHRVVDLAERGCDVDDARAGVGGDVRVGQDAEGALAQPGILAGNGDAHCGQGPKGVRSRRLALKRQFEVDEP